MWEINSKLQILNFLYSIILGVMFDLFYDVFKAFRLTIKCSDFFIFIQDIIYFMIVSIVSFCFFLVFTCGEIRFYILTGLVIGFFVSRFSLSRIFVPILRWIITAIIIVRRYSRRFFRAIHNFFDVILKKVQKNLKKTLKSAKKLLKKAEGLLYTIEE